MAPTAGATLPGDVILEIVARLEEASALVRCAATCRRWRALVADPSFLRDLWPDRSLVGFFTNEWRRGEGVSIVPGPRSALGAGRRLLSSYIPDAPVVSDWVQPLASHHGLLLVRLFPRNSTTMQLAVCDPLAGTWVVLPTLRVNDARYFIGYAIVATGGEDGCLSSSPREDSASFRVLLVRTEWDGQGWYDEEEEEEEDERNEYTLHAFSSDEPSWSAPIKFPNHVEHSLQKSTIAHADAAVRGGLAHWLFTKSRNLHILRVHPQTGRIASTQILIPGNHHQCIRLTTTADGTRLSLCTYNGDRRVEVWEQEDGSEDGNVRWLCTNVFNLGLQLQGARFMCFGARSRRLLIMDRRQRIYVLDIKGGAMEEMEDPSVIAVPMEVDWPSFFMSRLRLM